MDIQRAGKPRHRLSAGKRKRRNLTFRVRDQMRVDLGRAARAAGRSISEEIEYRLERSFWQAEAA